MKDTRPTLAVDFDGVIHRYSKGWQGGEIYDELTDGCKDALIQLDKRYRLVIFTARTNLIEVGAYLVRRRLIHLFDDITNVKPQAVAYLDDRGIHFDNWAQALKELLP